LPGSLLDLFKRKFDKFMNPHYRLYYVPIVGVTMKSKMSLAIVAIASITLASATQAEVRSAFPFSKPELNAEILLDEKDKIPFDAIGTANRGTGTNIFKQVSPSVVKILTNEGSGSGIVISRGGLVLTNNHVVDGYSTVGVVFLSSSSEDEVVVGEVVRINEIADLALVLLPKGTPGLVPVKVRQQPPQIGDDVHAIGHPLGENWTYTRGYVSQLRDNYSWQTATTDHHVANVIQTQTPINPGNSGGPLLNDKGELIGVNSFGNSRGEGINFAVDLSTVDDFLKRRENVTRTVSTIKENELIDTEDNNKNENPDFYVWDQSHNKVGDLFGLDDNEDSYIDKWLYDENENGVIEVRIFESTDPDLPGIVYIQDTNEDGTEDTIQIDIDKDGKPDVVRRI